MDDKIVKYLLFPSEKFKSGPKAITENGIMVLIYKMVSGRVRSEDQPLSTA